MPIVGALEGCYPAAERYAPLRLSVCLSPKRSANPSFRKAVKAAAKEIGGEGLLPHDMRRSGVRNFRKSGLSESEGMALSGHKNAVSVQAL